MVLRDRRSLVAAVLLPLVLMPVMLFSASWVNRRHIEHLDSTLYRYAVIGSQAETVRRLIASADHRRQDDGAETNTAVQFEELPVENALAALAAGELHLVIEALAPGESRTPDTPTEAAPASAAPAATPDGASGENRTGSASQPVDADVPVIRLVYRADREESNAGRRHLGQLLQKERLAERKALLQAAGFPVAPADLGSVQERNVATEGQVAGLLLGRVLTLFLLLLLIPSAAVVATDSLAGEKERGTLETLLTTAAGRVEIIASKHLAILAVTLGITLIQAANLLVYVGFELIPLPAGLAAAVTPGMALMLVLLYLPVAGLVAGVLLVTSGYARSYKEAQLYFMPVFLLGLVPTLAPFLPGLPFRSVIVLVPVANIALGVREILTGTWDWPMLLLSWLVTALAAHGVLVCGVRFLTVEKLVTAGDDEAPAAMTGPARFEQHVLRWFAVLWAMLLVVGGYLPAATDLRIQVVVNIVVLFLGASLFLLWRYRLDPRATLALRPPRPMVWVAVLLGVPGGILTGIGVFRLADRFIPVPPQMIEAFSQGLLSGSIPFWQLLVFLAVIPGIVEEITFRGVLLRGLHRRLHPALLILVVGAMFGLFHGTLFRVLPTALLGMLLTAVTLQTGSLYPAVLWHILHNATSVAAGHWELPLDRLEPTAHVAGVVILAAALWIIWRHRTPYPGLRPWLDRG